MASDSRYLVFANKQKGNSIYITDPSRHIVNHIDANFINIEQMNDKLVIMTTDEVRVYDMEKCKIIKE